MENQMQSVWFKFYSAEVSIHSCLWAWQLLGFGPQAWVWWISVLYLNLSLFRFSGETPLSRKVELKKWRKDRGISLWAFSWGFFTLIRLFIVVKTPPCTQLLWGILLLHILKKLRVLKHTFGRIAVWILKLLYLSSTTIYFNPSKFWIQLRLWTKKQYFQKTITPCGFFLYIHNNKGMLV